MTKIRTRGRFATVAGWIAAFFVVGVPAGVTAWVLLGDYGAFFWDAKTLPCGIEAAIDTGRPNAYRDPTYPGECAGYRFSYTAPPAITAVLAGIGAVIGTAPFVALYAVLYAAALVAVGIAARRFHGSLGMPLLFAASFACGVFVFEAASANLSIVFGGLLTALFLSVDRRPAATAAVPLVALCVVASLFKPHYALYLLVPLLAYANYAVVSFAAAAVSLWYAVDALLHPAAFADWLNLILPIVHGETHFGFMKLMQLAGYAQGEWLLLAASYVAWSAVVVGLTLRVTKRLESPVDRAFAALACATLLLPRLKEYDCLVLVPLFFWLAHRGGDATRRWLATSFAVGAFVVPALWWWGRKLPLLAQDASPTLRAAAELKWLIEIQGIFVAGGVFILFATMVATLATRDESTRANARELTRC